MARVARKDFHTSFFHVIVQGINKEYLFQTNENREKYRKLMKQYENEEIQVVAYCIMHSHAHLLLYVHTINALSKYMHQINSLYAQYYNHINPERVGYVFKGRFLSEPIDNQRYFYKCINYIHQNPVKARIVSRKEDYAYSSCQDYINKVGCAKKDIWNAIDDKTEPVKILERYTKNVNLFMDLSYNKEDMLNDEIVDFLEENHRQLFDVLQNRKVCEELIKQVKKENLFTYADIMKKWQIGKNRLAKILKENKKDI